MRPILTFKIWFDPAINGRSDYVSDPLDPSKHLEFHERASAETIVEHYNGVNNGAWNGTFSVKEYISGRPE